VQKNVWEGVEAHQNPATFSGSSGGAVTSGLCSLAASFARVWEGECGWRGGLYRLVCVAEG
jgi:hypothetical protein